MRAFLAFSAKIQWISMFFFASKWEALSGAGILSNQSLFRPHFAFYFWASLITNVGPLKWAGYALTWRTLGCKKTFLACGMMKKKTKKCQGSIIFWTVIRDFGITFSHPPVSEFWNLEGVQNIWIFLENTNTSKNRSPWRALEKGWFHKHVRKSHLSMKDHTKWTF